MKKTFTEKLCALLLCTILATASISSSYAQCEIDAASAPSTANSTIESVWSIVPSHDISQVLTGTTAPTGFSASWKSVYTSTNLYVLFQVTKTTVTPSTLYKTSTWWQSDGVEVYIDGDDSRGNQYDGVNDYQFGVRYNDGTNVSIGQNNPSGSTAAGITY